MSTLEMDPVFTAALREALVRAVATSPRARRRLRWRVGAGLFVGLSIAAGGVAIATGLFSPPGAPINTTLGTAVTATRTGTATIDLGAPPAGATDMSLTVTCLSVGTFDFPNGSSESCDAADLNRPPLYRRASEVVPISPGVDSVTIKTSPDATWTLQAVYVNQVSTTWGVNANGQTYGVSNRAGTPDLIAVAIDHGTTQGYVEKRELDCASGDFVSSPAQALAWDQQSRDRNISIPVYLSDGTTVIGSIIVGDASGANAVTVPVSSLTSQCDAG
jgi:hypothetical protein